ncbi:mitochondrial ribonuclease P protein 1-like [Tropilaelaps mercedesae]|uniref:RNA (guanine-9-)-methyltransferase domain-containing protein 1 n=1 Tax=Tropilaelaps mercedesae TaxID=418985 RepID=A0A1V9XZT8_9ACAR|nr:mitochondrial ribonuclease P protein 1-like [Tropilaelaps mercedesae]
MFAMARSLLAAVRCKMHFMAIQGQYMSSRALMAEEGSPTKEQKTANQENIEIFIDEKEIRKRLAIQPVEYSVNDFKELIKNESDSKQIHLALLELVTLRETTGRAPCVIDKKRMAEVMKLRNLKQRAKFYGYLFKTEMTELNRKIKKEKRRIELESISKKPTKMAHAIYPIIREHQQRLFYNSRLASAAMFGQKLVIDCGFEDSMSKQDLTSLMIQIQLVFAANKVSRDPFDLILSDVEKGKIIDQQICKFLPQVESNSSLITKSYDSYLNMFPNKRIIYLSPNSDRFLHKLDPEMVVVVGGIVDKSREVPLTLGKAKEQRIEHAKLPIGQYLPQFRVGSSQAFAVHIVAEILLTLKATNDWNQAFQKVPRRIIHNIEKQRSSSQIQFRNRFSSLKEAL